MSADNGQTDVRDGTSPGANAGMDDQIEKNIEAYATASPEEITDRIHVLEREWDIERALQMSAGGLSLLGFSLAAWRSKRWLWMSGIVTSFLVWHSIQGWSPPVPLLRRAGLRTRAEIDREIYALRAMRGDFQKVHKHRNRPHALVTKAMEAISMEPESTASTEPSSEQTLPAS